MNYLKFFPVIGLTLFLLILYAVGLEKIVNSLFSANPFFLGIAFLFFLPLTFLQTFKWNLLLKYQEIKLPFKFLTKVFLISSFYAAVTPGKLGSFMRIPYIKKKSNRSLFDCSVNVLIDRLMDVFSLFLIALVGFAFLPFLSGFSGFLFLIIILMIFAITFTLFFHKEKLLKKFILIYDFLVPERFKQKNADKFEIKGLNSLSNFSILKVFLFSILIQLIVFIQAYFIALSFDIFIPLPFFIAILSFSSIITLIPISVQGIGTREAVLLYFFSFFAVDPSKTVVFSVSALIILYLFVLIFGGYFSVKEKI